MVQNNQFRRASTDDPNAHLGSFIEIYDTVKMNEVIDEAIRFRLFSFSLRDKVKAWFPLLPYEFVTTWNDLAQKFLTKFFPPSKSAQLRSEIFQFRQLDFKPFYEAYERFKNLFRRCPQHYSQSWMQIEIFYNRLYRQIRTIVDTAVGRILMGKTIDATYSYQLLSERSSVNRVAGLYEVDLIMALSAQVFSLTTQSNQQNVGSIMAISSALQEIEIEHEHAYYVNNRIYNQR